MRHASQNVKSIPLMRERKVIHDVNLTGEQADVIGWQEITDKPVYYMDALHDLPGFLTFRGHEQNNSPISWRVNAFRRISDGTTLLHEAVPGVCGPRWITWVVLEDRVSREQHVVINTHFVPGAFSPFPKKNKTGRRMAWDRGLGRLHGLITDFLRDGLPVVVLGDFNRKRQPLGSHVDQRPVTYASDPRYIDHIVYVSPLRGPEWDVKRFWRATGRKSDHQGRIARAEIRTPDDNWQPHTVAAIPTAPEATVKDEQQAKRLIEIARKEIGYHEGRSGGHWNNDNKYAAEAGHANGYAWCATFVVAMFRRAGLAYLLTTPSAGVDQLAAGFKRSGRWSEYPAEGAVVCYGTPNDLNHTGIVVAFNDDYIWAVEGNTNSDGSREGSSVLLKKRERRGANVVGYGYPDFVEGIVSADPAWQRKPEPTPEAPATPETKPETRITAARELLTEALANTKRPRRRAKIKAALDALPER